MSGSPEAEASAPSGGSSAKVFVVKAQIADTEAQLFEFEAAKTMYGGRTVAVGDTIFLFASENEGGRGMIARGIVTYAKAVPEAPGLVRQTPRVDLRVERLSGAVRPLGRTELKEFRAWNDGRPETELNFKLYRQATNKIVGISSEAARFLKGFF